MENKFVPLWANVIEAQVESDTHVLSDLPLENREEFGPIIVTFYSLKGGVGRTTSLSRTALILANQGYRVVCVDGDLEAPGLSDVFDVAAPIANDKGLLPLLVSLEVGDISGEELLSHFNKVGNLDLYVLPAGNLTSEYARALRWVDVETWYSGERNPARILNKMIAESPLKPDVIIWDARTGISQTSAPFLFSESDVAIICFNPNLQAKAGNALISRGMATTKNYRGLNVEPRYVLSPLPNTVSEFNRLRERGIEWISEWISPLQRGRKAGAELIPEEIICTVAYNERMASKDHVDFTEDLSDYSTIANWISSIVPPRISNVTKVNDSEAGMNNVIQELYEVSKRNTGVAETDKEHEAFFIESEQYTRILDDSTSFVLGRKGTGKTSLFIHLLNTRNAVPLAAPRLLQRQYQFTPDINRYLDWHRKHHEEAGAWRRFWLIQTIVSFTRGDIAFEQLKDYSEADLSNTLNTVFTADNQGSSGIFIVDGLDDGFGSDITGNLVRMRAIEGLLDYWYQYGSNFTRYKFKIFVRYDLWQRTQVVNKSHFYGYSVELKWKQEDYLNIVTKLASRSDLFARYYCKQQRIPYIGENTHLLINHEEAWRLIFGERMDAGKSAYTRSWVWNRLADAQGEHSVRMLLVLFRECLSREVIDPRKTKTLIRPRYLIDSLDNVSQQARSALEEEYSLELANVFNRLERIDTSPFTIDRMGDIDKTTIDLAVSVGLLEEKSDGRLSVPDLYRYAFKVGRRGQA
ncbi:KGGVGR-motif variant AAA ATPase [Deinococcus pimensis]|uniref:KGGVGR-motif variant AAA ATPase n=1 Tax=Deinococcus pimensis TaxID=309888 RepID=UPI0004B06226|nr:AAA family ATPase [Deinococcus pimensis]